MVFRDGPKRGSIAGQSFLDVVQVKGIHVVIPPHGWFWLPVTSLAFTAPGVRDGIIAGP